MSRRYSRVLTLATACVLITQTSAAQKQRDESELGEILVTGETQEHVTSLAILPSLSPAMSDVIVRSVVRRDFELTGMFRMVADAKAPAGAYNFNDPVDVDAWRKVGAEVIVKVAARKRKGKIEVTGLAYFLSVGKEPVYEKKLVVDESEVRVTAHRITDALLGAITGNPGGFASHLTYSGKWGKNRRVFTLDADGHALTAQTPEKHTAIVPTWGGDGSLLYYTKSKRYEPFRLFKMEGTTHSHVKLPFKGSIYSVAFDQTGKKMALSVGESGKSTIYVGNPDGSSMVKASNTELATHPVFSPSGKLAWVGGSFGKGAKRRVYIDGKPASPGGYTASAPTFCDTEDGERLVYSVNVGGDNRDLVMANNKGQVIGRLTKGQGSNTYPACSPDGRLLAFFSTRKRMKATYVMSLKRWKTQRLSPQWGESLRWARLPPPAQSFKSDKKKPAPAAKKPEPAAKNPEPAAKEPEPAAKPK